MVDTDYGDRRIDGYVESFEADLFSAAEQFVISILCPRPEFTDGSGVVLTSSSADTMNATFEFPFESRWLMDDIEFGTPQDYAENIIYYSGEVPTGCEIHIDILSDPGKNVVIEGPRGTRVVVDNVNSGWLSTPSSGRGRHITSRTELGPIWRGRCGIRAIGPFCIRGTTR